MLSDGVFSISFLFIYFPFFSPESNLFSDTSVVIGQSIPSKMATMVTQLFKIPLIATDSGSCKEPIGTMESAKCKDEFSLLPNKKYSNLVASNINRKFDWGYVAVVFPSELYSDKLLRQILQTAEIKRGKYHRPILLSELLEGMFKGCTKTSSLCHRLFLFCEFRRVSYSGSCAEQVANPPPRKACWSCTPLKGSS